MGGSSDRKLGDGSRLYLTSSDQTLVHGHLFQEQTTGWTHLLQNQHIPNRTGSTSFGETEDANHNDCDLSDGILRYINHVLMEEDMEEKTHMLQESSAFQSKERSFYELIGKRYPHSPLRESPLNGQYSERLDYVNHHDSMTIGFDAYHTDHIFPNSVYSKSRVIGDFEKGVDDASKFLPSGNKILDANIVLVQNQKEVETSVKNNELNMKSSHSRVSIEEFDEVLLKKLGEIEITDMQNTASKSTQQSGAKGRRINKQNRKKQVIDLTSLLLNCAQFVQSGDIRSANELLKQIRDHSSPFGDGNQRLAHYFADGIEARLTGTGSQICKTHNSKIMTAFEHKNDFYTSIISCPIWKISNFSSNNMIAIRSKKATRVHIIEFGILCGLQWPTFIKRIAEREGGPPKLRITCINIPQPGIEPAESPEDSGRRLARYAKIFNVPFEFRSIAQEWETIKVEDFKIENDEFVAVSCSFQTMYLLDETAEEENSRTMFLNLIRKINPDIFVHAIVNASYGEPLFLTRFRELFYHFSALFDMLETNIHMENPERMLLERDIMGRQILNVIACEGRDRVERPETHRQWQLRHLKAGFTQVPFERKLIDTATHTLINFYRRDFLVDEDNHWLLMSWKGRIIYAISCWQPDEV